MSPWPRTGTPSAAIASHSRALSSTASPCSRVSGLGEQYLPSNFSDDSDRASGRRSRVDGSHWSPNAPDSTRRHSLGAPVCVFPTSAARGELGEGRRVAAARDSSGRYRSLRNDGFLSIRIYPPRGSAGGPGGYGLRITPPPRSRVRRGGRAAGRSAWRKPVHFNDLRNVGFFCVVCGNSPGLIRLRVRASAGGRRRGIGGGRRGR